MKHLVEIRFERRASERQEIDVSTAAKVEGQPVVAVLIDEVSTTGFSMVAAVPVEIGEAARVSLPSIGERTVSIVRGRGMRLACAFDEPIAPEELKAVIASGDERRALQEHRAAIGWRPEGWGLAA
ncbi:MULTISPECIES: hypothetical protein [unclassified Sphingomonas]|uniref:hypothetical protein n=1 Tax=unclassified Sphingomonas TaxID=196159 RepID=UPI0022698AA5|nr:MULTISPECIES: hypothetical protein [unclassified Sphingomonas]